MTKAISRIRNGKAQAKKEITYKVIFIKSLNNKDFKLKEFIPATLEFSQDLYTATNYDLEIYGYGDTEFEAVNDLKEDIIDYYKELKAEKGNLGPLPQRHWQYLSSIIERI